MNFWNKLKQALSPKPPSNTRVVYTLQGVTLNKPEESKSAKKNEDDNSYINEDTGYRYIAADSEKSDRLLKEAGSLIDTDTDMAIKKIKEAVATAKKRGVPYNSLGDVCQRASSIFYKAGRYEDYFYYVSLSTYYLMTHNFTCIPGGVELLDAAYEERSPIFYTGQTNFERALKKLGRLDVQEEYEETLMQLFDELKGDIYDAAIYKDKHFSQPDTDEYRQKLAGFTDKAFDRFYKAKLHPLLFQ